MENKKLKFTGSGSEYFKIWISNVFFSIITLGIYSAWAKVRTVKYFYNNTHIENSNFDYTADPKKILKGRAILLIIYIAFNYIADLFTNPFYVIGFLLIAYYPLIPIIVTQARKFRLRNTTFSGIRFSYHGSIKEASKCFILYPILSLISLFIAKPFELRKSGSLLINNSKFGNTNFQFNESETKFGKIILKLLSPFLLLILISGTMYYLNITGWSKAFFPILLLFYVSIPLYLFRVKNEYINNTSIFKSQLKSKIKPYKLIYIHATNILLTIFSVGLYFPFAKVRAYKYKVENIELENFSLDNVQGIKQEDQKFSDELDDSFDLDFGI